MEMYLFVPKDLIGLYFLTETSQHYFVYRILTLSLTGVGPFGPSLTNMEFALKVLKVRYRQKLGIPQAGS